RSAVSPRCLASHPLDTNACSRLESPRGNLMPWMKPSIEAKSVPSRLKGDSMKLDSATPLQSEDVLETLTVLSAWLIQRSVFLNNPGLYCPFCCIVYNGGLG